MSYYWQIPSCHKEVFCLDKVHRAYTWWYLYFMRTSKTNVIITITSHNVNCSFAIFINAIKLNDFRYLSDAYLIEIQVKLPVFNVMFYFFFLHKFKLFHRYDYHFNKYGNWIVLNMIFPWPFHFTYFIDGNMSTTYDYIT